MYCIGPMRFGSPLPVTVQHDDPALIALLEWLMTIASDCFRSRCQWPKFGEINTTFWSDYPND